MFEYILYSYIYIYMIFLCMFAYPICGNRRSFARKSQVACQ